MPLPHSKAWKRRTELTGQLQKNIYTNKVPRGPQRACGSEGHKEPREAHLQLLN